MAHKIPVPSNFDGLVAIDLSADFPSARPGENGSVIVHTGACRPPDVAAILERDLEMLRMHAHMITGHLAEDGDSSRVGAVGVVVEPGRELPLMRCMMKCRESSYPSEVRCTYDGNIMSCVYSQDCAHTGDWIELMVILTTPAQLAPHLRALVLVAIRKAGEAL
jgi:hypothetical protein